MHRITTLLIALIFPLSALAGAWGDGSFENDDALDWVGQCTQSTGTKVVSTALTAALKAQYLEAPEGSAAVAAAEVVAAAQGKANPSLPKELRAWLERQPKTELAALSSLARQVLRKIRDPKASELKQLWSEGKSNRWESRIAELEARIGG
jgi:hypothetical protein